MKDKSAPLPQTFKDDVTTYDLLELIHKGEDAFVFIALNYTTCQTCILKVFYIPSNNFQLLAMENEKNINKIMSKYSNCVTFQKYFVFDIYQVFVYPHVPLTLKKLIKGPGFKFKYTTYCNAIKGLLKGFNELHKENFIHLDIKVENIVVESINSFKIIDFGTCISSFNKKVFNVVGSKLNIPPEMLASGSCGISSDIWSLGLVFFEMANPQKEHLFYDVDPSVAESNRIFKDLEGDFYPTGFDSKMKEICKCMIVRDPSKRKTIDEILKMLN